MKTLAITTSTNRCAVALLLDANPIAERRVDEDRLHAERIFGLIDDVLSEAGWQKDALGLVACDLGPGSFTGVRVGLATAKGIALGLGLPIVGVGSLHAMAQAALQASSAALVLAVLDARRGERFVAAHTVQGVTIAARQVANTELSAFASELPEGWRWCGDAGGLLEEARGVVEATSQLPEASWIGKLAVQFARTRGFDCLATLEPVYVRGPDAKLPAAAPDWRLQR